MGIITLKNMNNCDKCVVMYLPVCLFYLCFPGLMCPSESQSPSVCYQLIHCQHHDLWYICPLFLWRCLIFDPWTWCDLLSTMAIRDQRIRIVWKGHWATTPSGSTAGNVHISPFWACKWDCTSNNKIKETCRIS